MKKSGFLKGILLTLICIILVGQPITANAEQGAKTANPFQDVSENEYYYDAILWAVENGITTGITSTTFGVKESCTRGQGITFLWRAEGCPAPEVESTTFLDIKKEDYYYNAVLWSVGNHITNGYSNTKFVPNDALTRGQFITFLYRLMGEAPSSSANPFTDVAKDAYYYDAVLWAVENGITTGITESTFNPDATCLRVQVVTFLNRAYLLENEEEPEDENDIGEIIIEDPTVPANAAEYGLSTEDDGQKNSKILQAMVDVLSETGGTIYIPAGEYAFAANGTQAIGNHCIKMKSNVTIIGDGEKTILKPTGESFMGLDMFYFNDYLDTGEVVYLENCNFEDFVIDSENTSSRIYTSAGKGFMINLFKNCSWKNIIVKNTDGTGFGVDCPIGGSMENCIAVDCGKAAKSTSTGAAGFGIGFGYSEEEVFTIKNCKAYGNKTFGFFFEHQARFNGTGYPAASSQGFLVSGCESTGNYYNFGGVMAFDVVYENCVSKEALQNGYYFENSKNCKVLNCSSSNDSNSSFSILQVNASYGLREVTSVVFEGCSSINTNYGAEIISRDAGELMADNAIKNCNFTGVQKYTIVTEGTMDSLTLEGNVTDCLENLMEAVIENLTDENNSWPKEEKPEEDSEEESSGDADSEDGSSEEGGSEEVSSEEGGSEEVSSEEGGNTSDADLNEDNGDDFTGEDISGDSTEEGASGGEPEGE